MTGEHIGGVTAYDQKGKPRCFEVIRVDGRHYIFLDGAAFDGPMKHSEAIQKITTEISAEGWTRTKGGAQS